MTITVLKFASFLCPRAAKKGYPISIEGATIQETHRKILNISTE